MTLNSINLIVTPQNETEKIVVILSIAIVTIISLLILSLLKSSKLRAENKKLKQ
ncbi:hypothetical protein [Ichthyenterobacterium magnum]|uniref:Uncharacterized protein n=1 Tax=Ichthyenterobacterium magnum TaxID=1230530 RepID=A0A420DLP8_9FLAO|nr:hypothetical protein [Ichthyenterobacterium magnum]RKE95204.1 hypothetical protein BXY80_1390 [Ichthyenterobacterium magnum]